MPSSRDCNYRLEEIQKELPDDTDNTDGTTKTVIFQMFSRAKKQLRVPITKPEVYKPLLLILTITCLQHFSGFTFTKKFLLQIVAPSKEAETSIEFEWRRSSERHGGYNHTVTGDKPEENHTGYYYAILINIIRTAANLLMSKFLMRFRVRFLFCLSLFSTALCLGLFGCFQPVGPLHQHFSSETDQVLRVLILAIHVFAVQFGLQVGCISWMVA